MASWISAAVTDRDTGSPVRESRPLTTVVISSCGTTAEPTAIFLEKIFSYNCDEPTKRIMGRIGYCAGKTVYLLDALDDLPDDIRLKGYNPIAVKFGLYDDKNEEHDAKQQAKYLINVCITELAASFELLNINRYKSILGNVIYLGLPKTLEKIIKGDKIAVEEKNNE